MHTGQMLNSSGKNSNQLEQHFDDEFNQCSTYVGVSTNCSVSSINYFPNSSNIANPFVLTPPTLRCRSRISFSSRESRKRLFSGHGGLNMHGILLRQHIDFFLKIKIKFSRIFPQEVYLVFLQMHGHGQCFSASKQKTTQIVKHLLLVILSDIR